METDMSPIDDSYDPEPMAPPRQYYREPEPQYYQAPPPPPPQPMFAPQSQPQKSFFADIDTTTWVIIGLMVLIAFFMGKTMQPVIIRGP
jgi:hypothetical protein